MDDDCPTFFGKYRGTVTNPVDLQGLGRVQVSVPDVLGDGKLAWAMPCTPYGGDGVGFFAIPPKDAKVWVEFERGDPDYPIWTGCFWGLGENPAGLGPLAVFKTVLKTDKFNLEIDSNPALPGFKLEMTLMPPLGSASIATGPTGLEIKCGGNSIVLGPFSVDINKPNLTVLK
jgi:hypothetical protein